LIPCGSEAAGWGLQGRTDLRRRVSGGAALFAVVVAVPLSFREQVVDHDGRYEKKHPTEDDVRPIVTARRYAVEIGGPSFVPASRAAQRFPRESRFRRASGTRFPLVRSHQCNRDRHECSPDDNAASDHRPRQRLLSHELSQHQRRRRKVGKLTQRLAKGLPLPWIQSYHRRGARVQEAVRLDNQRQSRMWRL